MRPFVALCVAIMAIPLGSACAADLSVEIRGGKAKFVGAISRWDEDGNARRKVDAKAKIESPAVDAAAKEVSPGHWIFKKLPAGKYDLVILGGQRTRIEGFFYPPVLEFDPPFPGAAATDAETHDFIVEDIKKSQHYENIVSPLFLGGDKKAVRVLVMLIRDKPTSLDATSATMRHEIWQYSNNYGGWVKERRTRVLDRVILPRDELRQWTWLWDPALGGIEIKGSDVKLTYGLPQKSSEVQAKGLSPY